MSNLNDRIKAKVDFGDPEPPATLRRYLGAAAVLAGLMAAVGIAAADAWEWAWDLAWSWY